MACVGTTRRNWINILPDTSLSLTYTPNLTVPQLTNSLTPIFTYFPSQSHTALNDSLTLSFSHSSTHSRSHLLIYKPTKPAYLLLFSVTPSFTPLLTILFSPPLTLALIHSYTYSFPHLLTSLLTLNPGRCQNIIPYGFLCTPYSRFKACI